MKSWSSSKAKSSSSRASAASCRPRLKDERDMSAAAFFKVAPGYQPLMRQVGLDADAVFTHPDIAAWRKLPDRENCTLDAEFDGRAVRLHIKRYLIPSRVADDEAKAIELLRQAGIPTVELVGWGRLTDGRSFVITEDLAGFRDSEKLVRDGVPFESLLAPTADLSA